MVVGLTASLEEARANGEAIDDETINGLRAGLMGPLAGLGDSIIVGTFIPILLGIALGLSKGGSVLGPLFYVVVWNLIMYFGMKFAYDQAIVWALLLLKHLLVLSPRLSVAPLL